MESWLLDVKRVRIPRPKFGSGSSVGGGTRFVPHEPPKDYYSSAGAQDEELKHGSKDIAKATEQLRRALQEKL